MAVNLQIAIPLFVTFVLLLAMAVIRKYIKPETVILCVAVLGLGVVSVVWEFGTQKEAKAAEINLAESETVSIMLAQKYILQEQYDQASDIIDSLNKTNSDDARVLLTDARLSLLDGDSAGAVLLYRQLGEKYKNEAQYAQDIFMSRKAKALSEKASEEMSEETAVEVSSDADLESVEQKPENEAENIQEKEVDEEKIKAEIISAIQKDVSTLENTLSFDLVQAVNEAAEINNLASAKEADKELLKKNCESLYQRMTENTKLTQNPHLRIALLKGNVAAGNYSDVAKMMDKNVTSEELIVIAELYTRELISKSDFSKEYVNKDKDRAKYIADLCSEILKNNKNKIKDYEYKKYQQKINELKAQINDPVGFTLRSTMVDKTGSDSSEMRSKLYLALAKLENYDGNRAMANNYIEYAFGTSGDSDDENYRVPMMQMAAIIRGNANPEEIKNVAYYVDCAIDNSLPVVFGENVSIPVAEFEETIHSKNFRYEMANKVNVSTAMVNIGKINKDNFPQVEARVQILSDNRKDTDDIHSHLDVYDCGNKISDFTLEKIQFGRSRIILLCDVSDSMMENVEDLTNAIVSFSQDMQQGEEVSVVGFDDGIEFVLPFSSDPEVVKSYASQIFEENTTQQSTSLTQIIDTYFEDDINSNDIIVAMTDGQDRDIFPKEDIDNLIYQKVQQKGITVYTLGLGNVDAEYLQEIANAGNGNFLYADSKAKLKNFFDFIHGQLSNQYTLNYTSKNFPHNRHLLEISLEGELAKDEKAFYLADEVQSETGETIFVTDTPLSVHGLSAKLLYRSSENQVIRLKGTGFEQDMETSARLKGNLNYGLVVNFVDNETYELIIPGEIAVGKYDLTFSVGDKGFTFEDELTVEVQVTSKHVDFDEYVNAENQENTDNTGKGE